MNISKPSSRLTVFLLLCIGGFVAFVVMVIYPYHQSIMDATLDIETLQSRIKEQRVLYPVFKDILKKARFKETEKAPFSDEAKYTMDNTGDYLSVLKKIALKHKFKIDKIIPQIDFPGKNTGYMTVNLVIEGSFIDLRKFLISLEQLPFLKHIEKIGIKTVKDTNNINLKIWTVQK